MSFQNIARRRCGRLWSDYR